MTMYEKNVRQDQRHEENPKDTKKLRHVFFVCSVSGTQKGERDIKLNEMEHLHHNHHMNYDRHHGIHQMLVFLCLMIRIRMMQIVIHGAELYYCTNQRVVDPNIIIRMIVMSLIRTISI